MDEQATAQASRLLGGDREQAFEEGLAPVLRRALDHPVAAVLLAERADGYVTLLYGLLLLRRGHELEPLHEDLYRHVFRAESALAGGYPIEQFNQDVEQLLRWGALERMAETMRIRGYRDNRRERFRYRLSEDAVALLEWLEARLELRMQGRLRDGRDRLADVVGQLRELLRLLDGWRSGARGPDDARRAIHLLAALDDAAADIAGELLDFRAGMLAFAARPYDLEALKQVLDWLERYVSVYLRRIEELRGEILGRLESVSQPRYRRALAECREVLVQDLALAPRELRGGAPLRAVDELLDAEAAFFAARGPLQEMCERIDESARAVLRKMQRHLRDIERRNARLVDLRARLAELAPLDEGEDARLASFTRALVAAGHVRVDRTAPLENERARPPLPRSHKAPATGTTSRPLRPKSLGPNEARALRARREAEIRAWVESRILAGRPSVLLSEAVRSEPVLGEADAPRRWLDVARAAGLGGGRALARMGVSLAAREGRATVGDEDIGLDAPDAAIARSAQRSAT